MPQWKTLTLGVLSTICALSALVSGQFGVSAVCLAPALLFFGLWFYRSQRDRTIVKQATAQQREPSDQSTQTLPPMRSNGSTNSLFVPPPLQ
ncbi:MAG TPA: hypothetical protein VFV38_21955 [Ktedonobacteraceae bacterium]|nr:hypothetical protein [Ktedonobacteraceae bacterium]